MEKFGKLILFPCPVIEGKTESLSNESLSLLRNTSYFIVEKAKTARRFLKSVGHPLQMQLINIHEITSEKLENEVFLQNIFNGFDVGVISEAGCPGIADPGSEAVDWAHKNNIMVVPLVGPSSIFLALMASGFNGQNFAFNGYLTNKKPAILQELKVLENVCLKSGQTQIFMETPYRNAFILDACVQSLQDNTKLCVACDINGPTESIDQKKIKDWKKIDFDHYHKRPCIFLIGR